MGTALSILHLMSKLSLGHQIAAEYSSSTLYRMQMQLHHNRHELKTLMTGEVSKSSSVDRQAMNHIERDYDSGDEEDLLGLSPGKSKQEKPSMTHAYTANGDNAERNKIYQEEL